MFCGGTRALTGHANSINSPSKHLPVLEHGLHDSVPTLERAVPMPEHFSSSEQQSQFFPIKKTSSTGTHYGVFVPSSEHRRSEGGT